MISRSQDFSCPVPVHTSVTPPWIILPLTVSKSCKRSLRALSPKSLGSIWVTGAMPAPGRESAFTCQLQARPKSFTASSGKYSTARRSSHRRWQPAHIKGWWLANRVRDFLMHLNFEVVQASIPATSIQCHHFSLQHALTAQVHM